jgi:hypothetical protein
VNANPSIVSIEELGADPSVVSNQKVANEPILSRLSRAAIAMTPFVVVAILYLGLRVLVLGSLTYRNGQQVYASRALFC